MAEEQTSNVKENLPIRQNLVDTAVGFLLNPNVKQRPDDAKIAFLKQKGVTDSEIAEAFHRAKYEGGTAVASNENSHFVNAYPLPPYQLHNFWFHLRSYSSAFVSFAIAVYALHRFYKSYIEPWLFGSKSEQNEISAIKQQLTELNKSISLLTSTIVSLEEAVNNHIHEINKTSLYDVESVPKSIKDIVEEVSNVKSLLLNRFSFPAPPALMGVVSTVNKAQNGESKSTGKVVTIPKWQLRGCENGNLKGDSKEQLSESESKEKSSAELSSVENGLSSIEDQENNFRIVKDKVQDKYSKSDSENNVEISEDKKEKPKECLETNLSAKGKIQEKDSKIIVKKGDEKPLDEDSGIEFHNYLSDSESIDQTNERSVSAENSE